MLQLIQRVVCHYCCRKAKRCYEKAFALDSDCEESGAALVDTLNQLEDQVGTQSTRGPGRDSIYSGTR